MPGPLHGFRVIDFSTGTAGPRATGILCDYGAEVIWIEPPGGDRFREELAISYSVFNRGKKSVVLDLREGSDQAMVRSLLGTADVFVESRRPGAAARLGLGYDQIHDDFPHLVYCSISGFGPDGPHRDLPGYESLVHAAVGTMGEQPGIREAPIYEGVPFASIGAAYLASIGIVAALYRRTEDGVGRLVETSLLDGALAYLTMLWNDTDLAMPPRDPGGRRLIARNFVCSDGSILGVHTGAVGAFGRMMKLLGLDDRIPASEDGLDMGIPLTPGQRETLDNGLPEIFSTRSRDEWLQDLIAADICAIPLLPPVDVMDEPQVRHNRMVVTIDDPVLGPVQQFAPPARFRGTPSPEPSPAPVAGADTANLDELVVRVPFAVGHGPVAAECPLLDGLHVLDLGAFYAGPYGSRLLADLGADVVRVETLAGDPNRGSEGIFRNSHAGMRSLSVNLKEPDGIRAFRDAVAWADVVHHSMRPGAAERLSADYTACREVNPSAVYAYAPGWGSDGPLAAWQSFAPLMSGYVGAAYEAAGKYNEPVYPSGNEDPGNGLLGAFAMLAGLLHRRITGEGQYLEHPQLNAALMHMAHVVRREDGEVLGAMQLDPMQYGVSPLDRLYETADGWVCVAVHTGPELGALGEALGIDLKSDPRFRDTQARRDNDYALSTSIGDALEALTTAEVMSALQTAGVPAAVPLPFNLQGFLRDPANIASGRVAELPHPTRGRVREIAHLLRASHSSVKPHRLAPELGEHSSEFLQELGWDQGEIDRLFAADVVRGPRPAPATAKCE